MPTYNPTHWVWMPLLIFGTGFFYLAIKQLKIKTFDKSYILFPLLVLIYLFCIPFPFNLGASLFLLGSLLYLLSSMFSPIGRLGFALLGSGCILMVQSIFYPFYVTLAARYHRIDAIAPIANWFMKVFGLKTSISQSTIFVQTYKQVIPFALTLENLAIQLMLLMIVGAVVILCLCDFRKKAFLFVVIFLTGIFYSIFRFILLALIYINWGHIELFWMPGLLFVSFCPLILLYMKYLPLEKYTFPFLAPLNKIPHSFKVALFSFMGLFFLTASWTFKDPGETKQGRILIDEKHSDWEWTTKQYDTTWFGEKSGYNYYCMAEYLSYYYKIERNFEPITSSKLSNFDILIIKTPTSPFTHEEINSIQTFVESGGGLFLISDHTNVFGMSSYINPIARSFGLRFRYDATYDLQSGGLSVYETPKLFPHPVVRNIPPLMFATSCTLEAPLSADEVIIGYGLKTMYLDYSQRNFFNKNLPTPEMEFGLFLQAAGITHERGRVLAFTDSTIFSNFFMFIPGKPELLLGTINWLNREGKFYYVKNIFYWLGLLSTGLALFFLIQSQVQTVLLVLFFFSLAGYATGFFIFDEMNQRSYSIPPPHTKYIKVCFEKEHSDFDLPIVEMTQNPERSYHTFYVGSQRLGYVPQINETLEEALSKGNIVVLINPNTDFIAEEIRQVREFISAGGRLILLDDPANRNSTANQLLKPFDMRIAFEQLAPSPIYNGTQKIADTTKGAGKVIGGKPILVAQKKNPLLATAHEGSGIVVVFTDSSLFSDRILGFSSSVPNKYQKQLHEMEFWLLTDLIDMQN